LLASAGYTVEAFALSSRVPSASRIAALWNSSVPSFLSYFESTQDVARQLEALDSTLLR
jgi:hypothetical protein